MSSSESFVKDMFATFVRTLFKVIAFGFGVVFLIMAIGAFFGSNEGGTLTSVRVLPNANWKSRPFSTDTPTILRINVDGVIGLERHLTKEEIKLQLMESVDGQMQPGQVKAVLVTINTPGGVAEQADAIYRLLKTYKDRYRVPVYAYSQGLCASGGMYIACAADKVYSTPDSVIGHVGVLFSPPFFNFSGLMSKLGIQSRTMSAGKDKDSMNPFRPWHENEGQQFQYLVDFMYSRFLDVVSSNRPKLTREDLIEQGARLWPAPDAERLGYIDGTVGTIDDMLDMCAKEVGIAENYQFIELERREFFGNLLNGPIAQALFGQNKVEHHIRLPGDIDPELMGKPLYLFVP